MLGRQAGSLQGHGPCLQVRPGILSSLQLSLLPVLSSGQKEVEKWYRQVTGREEWQAEGSRGGGVGAGCLPQLGPANPVPVRTVPGEGVAGMQWGSKSAVFSAAQAFGRQKALA